MDSIWQDVRFSLRTLLRSPGFTAVAVFTLMLGIGVNSAIFTLVNAILLRPLPYSNPERLMTLWNWTPKMGQMRVSEPELLDYRGGLHSFEAIAAFGVSDANLSGSGQPERVPVAKVSASLFPILGARPAAGRMFVPEEDSVGHNKVVVLGYDLWRRLFGGSPDIIGKPILLNSESYVVVGVAPRAFAFPPKVELWTPMAIDPAHLSIRGQHSLQVIGKLKPGVTLVQARSEADVLIKSIADTDKEYAKGDWRLQIVPLREQQTAGVRRPLLVLQGAVFLVLLMACSNVASLLLARAQARRGEVALRLALGAGPWQIVRQLQFEGLFLGVAGGVFGLALARAGVRLLLAVRAEQLPRAGEITLDSRVVLWTFLIALLSGFIVSLAAALPATRTRLTEALADAGPHASGGSGARRFRNLLVISEVTLAVILLIGAGLLLKNFRHLQHVDPGFDPNALLTVRLTLPDAKYHEGSPAVGAFYTTLQERLSAIPQVQTVGLAEHLPFGRTGLSGPFYPEPGSTGDKDVPEAPESDWNWVTPGYFESMKMPLLRGRTFTASDREGVERVVIIDDYLAHAVYAAVDPIGKRIRLPGDDNNPWLRIVGVVGYVKQQGLDSESRGQLYVPHAQDPVISMFAVLRTAGPPASLTSAVRAAVQSLDKDQPVYDVMVMKERISSSLGEQRFSTLLMAMFAGLAVLLSAVGIYSVMAYSVIQRSYELGIRMALGAQPSDLRSMVVSQGMSFVTIGLALGLAAALAMSQVMRGMLFEVSVRDPAIFVGAPLVVALVSLLASYLPARRASSADPLRTLRQA